MFLIIIVFTVNVILKLNFVSGYDNIVGFLQSNSICWNETRIPGCHTSIPEVFTPSLEYVDFNVPDTKFLLYTRRNPDSPEPLHSCGGKLPPRSNFNKNKYTVVISHGGVDGICRSTWQREMMHQFLERGNYNVILVDWTWGNLDFIGGLHNSRVVGEQTAFVINNIMKQKRITGRRFHIIGHSYGGHVASFAGKRIQNLRRITVLDPAYPGVKYGDPSMRLTKTDANFVDVIHSNKGYCNPFILGDPRTLGHQDFFPNGGTIQLSCYSEIMPRLHKADFLFAILDLLLPQACFHIQSIEYFKVSINAGEDKFFASRCSSYKAFRAGKCPCVEGECAIMGMDSEIYYNKHGKVQGNFYLDTSMECPYVKDITTISYEDNECSRP